ncbi:hypothetical protein, partial [Aliivibrio fischeri]|uniref:hypothetical protein n=1 Tax=Aliivibrio fischeri TaxID=668 RepID=UPI001BE4472C
QVPTQIDLVKLLKSFSSTFKSLRLSFEEDGHFIHLSFSVKHLFETNFKLPSSLIRLQTLTG